MPNDEKDHKDSYHNSPLPLGEGQGVRAVGSSVRNPKGYAGGNASFVIQIWPSVLIWISSFVIPS
jgi:hypothetical protein